MKIKNYFKSKLVLFIIQILILSLLMSIFQYSSQIEFTSSISEERKLIIQLLSNYIMYNNSFGFMYVYFTWILVSLIPILIFSDFKKVYSMNLLSFFFPNFFFYVFYYRYSETYFNALFPSLILKTIILGITIVIISIGLSLILKFIKHFKKDTKEENLKQIELQIKTTCQNCGTEFNSVPKYCYNCNNLLTNELGEHIGNKK